MTTSNIEKGTTAAQVLLLVEAKKVSLDAGVEFLWDRITSHLDTAKKAGKMFLLATNYTYSAYATLTGKPSLIKEHKKAVWPEYDADYHTNKKAAKAPKTKDGKDKPVPTEDELIERYTNTSAKQLNNWLRKAQSPKKELIEAELARRVDVARGTSKPAKKAPAKKADKTPKTTKSGFASALQKMADMAGSDDTSDEEKAAFKIMLQTMSEALNK